METFNGSLLKLNNYGRGSYSYQMIFTFGEEFGWRGYLLPRLAPLGGISAAIITGVIWGLWHTPVIVLECRLSKK